MSESPRTQIDLTHSVELAQAAPSSVFLERTFASGLKELRAENWPTAMGSLESLGEPLLRVSSVGGESALFERDGTLLQVDLWGSHLNAVGAAREKATVDAAFEALHAQFPPPDPSSAHEVPITFWTYTPHGPQPSFRSIGVPGWDEIAGNYARRAREQLEAIMRGFEPSHGGQLILWHGEAGTGKTFALRALAWEWRDWCQFHYIVDPDSFFGEHADYLMSVLLQPAFPMMVGRGGFVGPMGMTSYAMVEDAVEDEEDGEDEKAWRVLVFEDTGELLSADARVSMGQGLSRFLNVVDGLIGQGLRVLVLVTTNEPIRRLHPAVARPGRCAANVEFVPLSVEEASDWLAAHDSDIRVSGPATIAELYARLEGLEPGETVPLVGFGDVG
jgi:Domain of unknown function (DUF5925)/ATPase family associated with various cellular activities (AAA)